MSITIGTIRGNCVYHNNAVVTERNYSPENWAALLNGEEVPVEFDENGNPTAWDFMEE
jgi:hypothetical protein